MFNNCVRVGGSLTRRKTKFFITLGSNKRKNKRNVKRNNISKISHSEVFLGKDVLKICSKLTGEHQWRRAI